MEFDLHVILVNIPALLKALETTIWVCAGSVVCGTVVGLIACLGVLYGEGIVQITAKAYVNAFRTLPEIVLIFWVYTCLPLIFSVRLSAVTCGVIAVSLWASAFLAEIFRAGVLSISRGQIEAAHALGIPMVPIWIKVIAPQAIRCMAPALINFLADLIKMSALLSSIAVAEVFYTALIVSGQTFRYLEMITSVAAIYFSLIFPLSLLARHYERRLAHRTNG